MRIIFLFFACKLIFLIAAHDHDANNAQWDYDDPRWDDKIPNWWDEDNFVSPDGPTEEKSSEFWMKHGQSLLDDKINLKRNMNKAKNLIILIGDGMGISTQMAARAYMGGEAKELAFEKFPYLGLSKIYCTNYMVPDSACTANAILTGVKNNFGTLGVNANVKLFDCDAQHNKDDGVDSIFKFAQDAGKATGIVTNTRITHATPAAAFARSSSRYWESNENSPDNCEDIAYQMIHGETGSRLDVAMGGGRRHFLPDSFVNENMERGWRTDSRNLIDEYLLLHRTQNKNATFVLNRVSIDNKIL